MVESRRLLSPVMGESYVYLKLDVEPKMFQVLLIACACIGGFLFGYDTGVISGALLLISDDFDTDDEGKELIVSILIAGAFVASCFAGWLSDMRGRRMTILVASAIFILGSLILAAAKSFTILVVGRLVVGFGVGLASSVVPCYLSETAPTRTRGLITTMMNLSIVIGQLVACLVAGAFVEVDHGWRYMLGLAAVPAAVQFLAFALVMPESPTWLAMKDDHAAAARVLRMIRSPSIDDINAEITALSSIVDRSSDGTSNDSKRRVVKSSSEMEVSPLWKDRLQSFASSDGAPEVRAGSSGKDRHDVRIIDLFNSEYTRRALLVGCGLQACQQLAGINTIMYYSATLLRLAGFTSNSDAVWLAAVVALCNVLGSLVGVYCVDRFGRRKLVLYSLTGVVCFLSLIAVAFYYAQVKSGSLSDGETGHCSQYHFGLDCVEDEDCGVCVNLDGSNEDACAPGDDDGVGNGYYCKSWHYNTPPDNDATAGWLVLVCLCGYLLAFGPGMGSMPWTVNSEIYCSDHRALANSMSTCTNWLCNFVMAITFLTLAGALSKQGAFALYACITAAFGVFFFKFLPEPAGVPLEDVPLLFSESRWGNVGLAIDLQKVRKVRASSSDST